MKVHELIELLSNADPDADVLIATQPSWPLQSAIRGIATTDDLITHAVDYDEDPCEQHENVGCAECSTMRTEQEHGSVVWLVEGYDDRERSAYAPSAVFDV